MTFDEKGDVPGPFRRWRIEGSEAATTERMTVDDVDSLETVSAAE